MWYVVQGQEFAKLPTSPFPSFGNWSGDTGSLQQMSDFPCQSCSSPRIRRAQSNSIDPTGRTERSLE